MSGLGELDRPENPGSPGAWDERSRQSLTNAIRDTQAPAGQEAGEDRPSGGGRPSGAGGAPGPVEDRRPGGSRWSSEGRSPGEGERAREDAGGPPVDGRKRSPSAAHRATADPVKALMHRHRTLCERAVDPLEIAAGLEAHGVTDRTAARFRHRDVFSLAEEMYARVPREADTPPRATDPPTPRARAVWIVLALLPGVLGAATAAGLRLTDGRPRLIVAVAGFLAVVLALRAAVRRGPLHAATRTTGTTTCWLLGYALLGDGLLDAALAGGPDGLPDGTTDGPWPVTVVPVLALALACAPATASAHFFAVGARRRLTASRGLADFSASVRPLLLGTLALFLVALTALLALTGAALGEPAAYPQGITLGALLLFARLLTVHGHIHAPTLVLTAAATAEAVALATLFAGRLPGCGFLAVPVETLVVACGPAGVPAVACGTGALTLLIHATRRLTRASAHASTEQQR
ncbi:hypothetical protein [Streptomyces lancefieldiae]|uniref:Integral membrane protein n=1 Tax=Streptomyces lancefieldiae TaxID=3075520 RepID=A0ABU3ANG2_9ACTN|nr:hypothetical protein [Streptomyces sp. DSM 40712]MDT0611736.1 hypothetical protein [Streptomyces sp. DSM 40712]